MPLRNLPRPALVTAALGLAVLVHSGLVRAEIKAAPGTLQELTAVQSAVQLALPVARKALVALETADGAASGVIVTEDGLVLTAAHVVSDPSRPGQPGRKLHVILSDGTRTMGTALGMDTATDAAMIQLEGKRRNWPYAPLLRGGEQVNVGQWCFALGHPGGHDPSRAEVLRVGKVLKVNPNNLQTDCVLMGGDSGGPLFNLDGEVIGIHSQIWEGKDQNMHVSLAPFLRSWDAMKDSQVVRVWERGSGGWLGVATRDGSQGTVEVADVVDKSPAAKVGLRAGDTLISVDKHPVESQEQFSAFVRGRAAGDSLVLLVRNRSGERIVTVKLAARPKE